jgi:hypothetical protein
MRRFQAHEAVASTLLEALVAKGILTDATDPITRPATALIQLPSRSAIEQSLVASQRPSAVVALEVMAIVCSTHRKLKTRALKENLDEARAYRDRKADPSKVATSAANEASFLRAAWQFAHARRYVPIEPVCLLDSLSLLRFLSRRGLPANIVFGVTAEPFAAHCWVQAGDIVLNETLSDASAHKPIRRV